MFKCTVEYDSIRDFKLWGGAPAQLEYIVERGGEEMIDILDGFLEEYTLCGEPLSETSINDFIWTTAYDMLVESEYLTEED